MSVCAKHTGFVHTDMDGDDEPSFDEVAHVNEMFAKHSLKEIRKQHPLFARGSDDKLSLKVMGCACVTHSCSWLAIVFKQKGRL